MPKKVDIISPQAVTVAAAQEGDSNKRLATQIADLVCSQGLILNEKKAEFQRELAAGKLKATDWTVLIEQALPHEPAAGGNHA